MYDKLGCPHCESTNWKVCYAQGRLAAVCFSCSSSFEVSTCIRCEVISPYDLMVLLEPDNQSVCPYCQ